MDESWISFHRDTFVKALQKADHLSKLPVPAEDRHKNSYAAAEVLQEASVAAEAGASASGSEPTKAAFKTASAVLDARRGLFLLDTEQSSQAEEAIQRGTKILTANPFEHVTLLQDVFNSLGILSSRGQDLQRSLEQLQQAEELYKAWAASIPFPQQLRSLSLSDSDSQHAPAESSTQGEESAALPSAAVQRLAKDKYAHTLFYLAQVYGMLDEPHKSSSCCAGTLSLQLELGIQDHIEWAQNCEQLADFYVSNGEVAVAEHLLGCAEAALGQAPQASSSVPGGRPQVEADIALTWAKLFSKRLSLSAKAREDAGFRFQPQLSALPENARFEGLLSGDEVLHWNGGLAETESQAKDLFNCGVRKLGQALEYRTLDGHVTMHCNITLEISELYRWLADFEQDKHKKCVLHKTRAKRVESVLKQLNREAWADVYRALQLDVGNSYKEIAEIKFEDGRPHEKVAAAAAAAKPFYEAYVDAFRHNGRLPNSLTAKQEEEPFIKAVFYLARVYNRLDPPVSLGNYLQTDNLRQAVDLYKYCAKFIKDNQISRQQQLAATCLEMASLIAENTEMLRVSAARQNR